MMADWQQIGNALAGFGAGYQGRGTEFLQGLRKEQTNNALKQLGQDLASGNIDQAQYLKGLASYSPETYSKVALAQVGVDQPADVRSWIYRNNLPQEQQGAFDAFRRAPQYLDLGDRRLNPSTGDVYPILPKPDQDPDFIRRQKEAEAAAARAATKTKAESALTGFEQQGQLVNDNIKEALDLIKGGYSTGWLSYASGLPNTDAGKLKNALDTVKANVGFDTLQAMRDNSPTGGALGNVSDTENRLLQAVKGALDPKQESQLVKNLENIQKLYPQVLKERQRAFKQDYGVITPVGNNAQPKEEDIPTGSPLQGGEKPTDTPATKTINGQTFINLNGQWYHQ